MHDQYFLNSIVNTVHLNLSQSLLHCKFVLTNRLISLKKLLLLRFLSLSCIINFKLNDDSIPLLLLFLKKTTLITECCQLPRDNWLPFGSFSGANLIVTFAIFFSEMINSKFSKVISDCAHIKWRRYWREIINYELFKLSLTATFISDYLWFYVHLPMLIGIIVLSYCGWFCFKMEQETICF